MKLKIAEIHYKKHLTFNEYLLKMPLSVCSLFYLLGSSFKNFLYDKNILRSYKTDILTISVGNLTTGGTGKTPITAEIAKYFTGKGEKVAILSRGYGGQLSNKNVNIISDGQNVFYCAKECGDEPFWLAANCPNTIILTCSSRIKASQIAKEKFNATVLILDDGFQHRKISRDVDILVIDSEKQFGNGNVLPLGPLRETKKSILRANKIIIANKNPEATKDVKKLQEQMKLFYKKQSTVCFMSSGDVKNIKTGEILDKPVKIIAFTGIGQPSQFYNIIPPELFEIICVKDFVDHHSYSEDDILNLTQIAKLNHCNTLITTEKDAVKIKPFLEKMDLDVDFFALQLKAELNLEEVFSDKE